MAPAVGTSRVDFLFEEVRGDRGLHFPETFLTQRQVHRGAHQATFTHGVAPEARIIAQMQFRRDTLLRGPTRSQQIQAAGLRQRTAAAQQEGILFQIAVFPKFFSGEILGFGW